MSLSAANLFFKIGKAIYNNKYVKCVWVEKRILFVQEGKEPDRWELESNSQADLALQNYETAIREGRTFVNLI